MLNKIYLPLKKEHNMTNRKLKCFSNQKGYDFIQTDDGKNIFLHFSAVQTERFKTLCQEIDYKISEKQKGPQAANVTTK
jgi:cold shock protein